MTLGIGMYAPCMILVSMLGMNATTAFPIMMGSCAFLMPIGGLRFIRTGRYNLRAAVGLTVGGVPAVLVAAFIVEALPLRVVQWLVVGVVVYTAAAMLRSARTSRRRPRRNRERWHPWLNGPGIPCLPPNRSTSCAPIPSTPTV